MNKKLQSVKKNFIYRLVYEVLLMALPLITTPYIARVLGADGVGIYSYASSFMTYFTMFAALGTASYGSREIARHRDDAKQASKIFWEIELMTVATSLVCLAAWGIVVAFGERYRPYFVALIPVLLGTMMDISWFFTGYEQIRYIVSLNIICKLLGLVMIFSFVKKPDDLLLYFIINSCVTLLGSVSMWLFLPKLLVKVDFKALSFKKHFHETLIYFIPTVATSIYSVLDKILIGVITQDVFQIGCYEQAGKIVRVANTVSSFALNFVTGARMSYLFAMKRYEEIRNRIRHSIDYILFMSYGCVFGIVAVAKRFVPAFFGGGYEPVIQMLYLMAPLVLIIGISNCLGCQYYTPSGQRKRSAKYIIIGSVVNFTCNMLLIPRYGAKGATVASIIGESVITVLYLAKCDKYLTLRTIWELSWKRMIAGCLMCAVVMWIGNALEWSNVACVFVQVAAGILIYIGLLAMMKDEFLHENIMAVWSKVTGKRQVH